MEQELETKKILKELKEIKKEIHLIKLRFDEMNLSDDEEKYLEEALKEHKQRKSISLDDFEKGMQNA